MFKKSISFILIIFSMFLVSGCSLVQSPGKSDVKQDIFSTLTSQNFSKDLSLEDGYKIVLPYAKKWSEDVILQYYMTNIPDYQIDYKALAYRFESIKKRRSLFITYNMKESPISEATNFTDPTGWELNKKFNVQDENWPTKIDGEDLNINEYIMSLQKSQYNDVSNFLTSDEILELAKSEGLDDVINKKLKGSWNSIWLFEGDDGIEWTVTYFVSKDGAGKPEYAFLARFNPTTGKLINKVIR